MIHESQMDWQLKFHVMTLPKTIKVPVQTCSEPITRTLVICLDTPFPGVIRIFSDSTAESTVTHVSKGKAFKCSVHPYHELYANILWHLWSVSCGWAGDELGYVGPAASRVRTHRAPPPLPCMWEQLIADRSGFLPGRHSLCPLPLTFYNY